MASPVKVCISTLVVVGAKEIHKSGKMYDESVGLQVVITSTMDKAAAEARLKIVEKRLIRRVQHYRFYGEVEATDLNCKATFGKVKLLVSGLVSRSQP